MQRQSLRKTSFYATDSTNRSYCYSSKPPFAGNIGKSELHTWQTIDFLIISANVPTVLLLLIIIIYRQKLTPCITLLLFLFWYFDETQKQFYLYLFTVPCWIIFKWFRANIFHRLTTDKHVNSPLCRSVIVVNCWCRSKRSKPK